MTFHLSLLYGEQPDNYDIVRVQIDKGKPCESRGRKVLGLKPEKAMIARPPKVEIGFYIHACCSNRVQHPRPDQVWVTRTGTAGQIYQAY